MAKEPVSLLLNPVAGRGRAGRRLPQIEESFAAAGIRYEVYLSSAIGDIEAAAREHSQNGRRTIVVAGGDGSIHEAVNGIVPGDGGARLGVIPTGTGNDFAKASGISLDWRKATQSLCARLAEREPARPIDVGRMNERYFANGAGVGFDAKVTSIARSYRLPIGDLVYLLAIFRGMIDGLASPPMRITAGDHRWDGPVTLANVANGPWVGGMFHIAPMAANGDGHFDLMIADAVTRRRILGLLPKVMSGEHMGEAEIHHWAVTDVLIETEAPVPAHLDGEMQALATRFEIALLPGALRLL